ncbi:hypothetical protein BC937DRAFT_93284 [Endogone sp. FLAS-F59071]|nr:hypothetical protein BC937DRAFT_93284 [Endogone sp. FLAS-F59071]|eukprot:RUS14815.1 hypothetical protein BC937DRAFT_93284 [Endogone sp. FLAS-F59071]
MVSLFQYKDNALANLIAHGGRSTTTDAPTPCTSIGIHISILCPRGSPGSPALPDRVREGADRQQYRSSNSPYFSTQVAEEPTSVATTDSRMARPPGSASKSDNEDTPSHIIMKSGLGQRFLCQIPLAKSKVTEGADDRVDDEAAGIRKGVEKGLQLLDPLKQKCLYYVSIGSLNLNSETWFYPCDSIPHSPEDSITLPQGAGWWTYEFCHLHYVRQFHQPPNAQGVITIPARDDPNVISYYLGIFGDDIEGLVTLPPGTTSSSTDTVSRTDLQTTGDKRYLVQRWGRGTICDITGRPRKVEIQFHCNMQTQEHISLIKETSTCHYLVVVHTPRLCQDPVFMSRSRTEVNQIVCNPIVSDTHYEILMAQELAQIEDTQRSAHVSFQADIEHEAAAAVAPVEFEAVATKEEANAKDAAAATADALERYRRQLDILDKLLAELERDVHPATPPIPGGEGAVDMEVLVEEVMRKVQKVQKKVEGLQGDGAEGEGPQVTWYLYDGEKLAEVEPPKENSGVNDKEPRFEKLDERDVTAETIAEDQGSDDEARRLSKREAEIQALLREVLGVGQAGAQAKQAGDKSSRKLAMNKILEMIQQAEKGERQQQQQQGVPEAVNSFGSGQEKISEAYRTVYEEEGAEKEG